MSDQTIIKVMMWIVGPYMVFGTLAEIVKFLAYIKYLWS